MEPEGIFYLTLASLALAVSTIIIKDAMNKNVDALSYIASVSLVAIGVCILYITLWEKNVKQKLRKRWLGFLVLSIGAGFLGRILHVVGTKYTTAMNSGFLVKLTVVTTLFFAFFLLSERISRKALAGALIALFGVFMLTTGGFVLTPNSGDLLLIIMVLIVGFTNVLAKLLMSDSSPFLVSSVRALVGSLMLVATIPFALGAQTFAAVGTVPLHILFGGISSTLFGFFLYKGFDIEGPSISSAFFLLSAVFTVILAYAFLNETLQLIQYAGAAILLAGLYLVARSSKKVIS